MTKTEKNLTKSYCNMLAIQKGIDAAGSAGNFEDAVIFEIPLPWKRDLYQKVGALPQEVIDLLALWLKRYHEGQPYNHRPLMIAPDPQYSHPGFRRVMYHSRPSGQFARYDKIEYLVPEAELGALVWALFEAKDDLARFEQYRDPAADSIRDLLVCTHGTVDAACAKFGYPLYKTLRTKYDHQQLRTWRVSHFGGHIYSPTLMDMPTGHYWAYVEDTQAEQIVTRSGSLESMSKHYRGCAAFEYGLMQAAEREMWQREGWEWFDYPKFGQILEQDKPDDADAEPQWAVVRIIFITPEGSSAYQARVEVRQRVETEHSSNNSHTYGYPQYQVMSLEKLEQNAEYTWTR